MIPLMDFGDAIRALKDGKRVARSGWNGKSMWLSLVTFWDAGLGGTLNPNLPSDMEWSYAPFIVMKPVGNAFVPWLASQTDVLAEDWSIVEG